MGSRVINLLLQSGNEVVALSRRGSPNTVEGLTSVKCDVADKDAVKNVFMTYGPFDSVLHAIGLLFDAESGLKGFNALASGSGSEPGAESTYDRITRQTSFNLIDAVNEQQHERKEDTDVTCKPLPFIFVSAAEAGWTWPSPVTFLERYLVAKRAVESRLLNEPLLRPVILRPSLIYTNDRPQAMASVIPFMIGSSIGIPGIEKPVTLDVLTKSAVVAFGDDTERGVYRVGEMTTLAERWNK